MTLPSERLRAVIQTRNFLLSLIDPQKTPRLNSAIRAGARDCLRHYPSSFEMEAKAEWFLDFFGKQLKSKTYRD